MIDILTTNTKLTPQQSNAIALLSVGKGVQEVADVLGVSRQALYNWMELEEFKNQLNKITDTNINMLILRGLKELEDILTCSLNNKDKLKAMEILAKMSERYSSKIILSDVQPKNIDIERVLKELETMN